MMPSTEYAQIFESLCLIVAAQHFLALHSFDIQFRLDLVLFELDFACE
jgi:hypothetical protein